LRVIGRGCLDAFCHRHADVREQIKAWLAEVEEARWCKPTDIKERYPSASLLENNRVVFNLKGNKYRLIAKVSYKNQVVRVMKVGTHAEYDRWKL
jgi:mRNA interferase HigB